jgi:hypothetical protein
MHRQAAAATLLQLRHAGTAACTAVQPAGCVVGPAMLVSRIRPAAAAAVLGDVLRCGVVEHTCGFKR